LHCPAHKSEQHIPRELPDDIVCIVSLSEAVDHPLAVSRFLGIEKNFVDGRHLEAGEKIRLERRCAEDESRRSSRSV
jgi:hypothetical protein